MILQQLCVLTASALPVSFRSINSLYMKAVKPPGLCRGVHHHCLSLELGFKRYFEYIKISCDYCSIECVAFVKDSLHRVTQTKLAKPLLLLNLLCAWPVSVLSLA